MKKFICESSVRFSMTMFGLLALSSFVMENYYLSLSVGIFMVLHAISVQVDIFYLLHQMLVKKKIIKGKGVGNSKDHNESRFASLLGASFLFIAFVLGYFFKYQLVASILILMVTFLTFLAGLTGFCVGSIIYVFIKKAIGK